MTKNFGEILGEIHSIDMTKTEKIERVNTLKNAIIIKKKLIEEFTLEKDKYMNGDDVIRAMENEMSNWEYELRCLEDDKR